MMYPARGGIDWGLMMGVLSEVRGSTPRPLGGLYNILFGIVLSWRLSLKPVLQELSCSMIKFNKAWKYLPQRS